MGLGGVAVGRKSGDPGYNPDVELPGYVTMDAMVSYALPVNKSRLTTQLNFYNLLDKDYYAGAYNRYHITTGTPLSVMGSLRYEF
jgi:iron complex outermembrane receptor protein